ncbi:MAG TPA: DHHA1 domain-containing protein, partial [Pontiella sp.]|nr:DHHA1 domain-containing protein [Pontiella sp.]
GISCEIETYHLGFQLGPRINAAGRIGEPMQALRLLTTDDPIEARNIAKLLDRTNGERRDIEARMADAAFAEIDEYFDASQHFGLVVAREGWHPGVVGIVASRVSRHYNRPAIIMGIDEDGSARGSCRSIEGFDLLEGLKACDAHLATYGGHKMAAGVAVKPGRLDPFREGFNAAAAAMLESADLSPLQHIDAMVAANDIDWTFFEKLKGLRPFGQENSEPVWAMSGMRVQGAPRVVGQKHLKLILTANGQSFEAIAFNYPAASLPAGEIDVAFTLKENSWNGNSSLQLQVQDIRAAK